jgi:OmpA-OmpF porin, OOP family
MMKRFVMVTLCVVVSFMLVACASQRTQTPFTPVDLNPKVQGGQYVQKVDSFLIINDVSLTMLDYYKGYQKLDIALDTISKINQTIPNLKLDAGLRIFGHIESFNMNSTRLNYGMVTYTKEGLDKSLDDTGRRGGLSPLEMAFDSASADDLKATRGRIAVIVVSDGEDMGNTQVQAAQNMKNKYGDRLCIYTIQVGNSPQGRKVLEQIANISGCGFMTNADNIGSPDNMASYIESVFFGKKPPEPLREVKREAEAPRIITMALNIEFDTGKTVIKPKYYDEIKKVADFMKENPQVTAMIEGHTDSVGNRKSNISLSKTRAASVRNYLISKFGISSDRLKSAGYGPDKPIADNKTLEGRQQNRRVQAVIDTNPKQDGGLADEKAVKKQPKKKAVKKAVKKKKSQ